MQEVRDNFLSEMQNAAKGQKTSLPFIKHTLSSKSIVQVGDQFQVLIIGGSIYLTAMFQKTMSGLEIVERSQGNLPAFHTKEVFLQFVEEQLKPDVKTLAVNFAYALNPIFTNGILDGELVWGSKEHLFEGMIGANVGVTIASYIKEKLKRDVTVSVANDTICLLLSGLKESSSWKETACGIVGTGVNFAFFLDEHTAINLEAAEFDKFELSESVSEMDKKTAAPGSALLEKETSGAYLYQKYNLEIKQHELNTQEITATDQLDQIVQDTNHPGNKIAAEIMERSAQFTALVTSAIMEFQQSSMTVCMTGSLFWKADGYKDQVEKFIKQLSPSFTVQFIKNEDAELYGAAKLIT